MTILFAANELDALNNTGGATWDTTAGTYDSNYTNGSIKVTQNTQYATASVSRSIGSETWIRCRVKLAGTNIANYDDYVIYVNGVGEKAGGVYLANGTWYINVVSKASYGFYTNASTGISAVAGNTYTLDYRLVASADTAIAQLWIDGIYRGQAVHGYQTNRGVTSINFWAPDHTAATAESVANYSEIIVSDESTLGHRAATLAMTGNSTTNTAWTGDYQDIDEAGVPNDTDLITSSSADEVETFTFAALGSPATDLGVAALAINLRASVGAVAPTNIQACIRKGGTNYFSSNISGLSTSLTGKSIIFENDPSTAGSWGNTNLSGVELGVKSIT